MANTKQKENVYSKGLTDISGQDGYCRPEIKVSRWALGTAIFRNNTLKLVALNLILLIFFAPLAYFIFVRYARLLVDASNSVFNANMGVGYLPVVDMVAMAEGLMFSVNREFFLMLPVCGAWASVGLSGALYVLRNMAWGEDVSIVQDFIKGIKRNFFSVMLVTLLYTLLFASVGIGISYTNYVIAESGAQWYLTLSKVLLYIAVALASVWFFSSLTMVVTYKATFFNLLRNAFLVAMVLLPLNVFFIAFAFIPLLIGFIGGYFVMLALALMIFLGISFILFSWTVYSHWVFDKFINGNVKNAYKPTAEELQKRRERERAQKEQQSGGFVEVDSGKIEGETYKSVRLKPVTDKDNVVYDLGETFSRGDLDKVTSSKQDMKKDSDLYEENPSKYISDKKKAQSNSAETKSENDAEKAGEDSSTQDDKN